MSRALHLPFLLVVVLGLTIGPWVALVRIGWGLPGAAAPAPASRAGVSAGPRRGTAGRPPTPGARSRDNRPR